MYFVSSSDVQLVVHGQRFNNRVLTKYSFQVIAHLFYIRFVLKAYRIAAATAKLYALIKTMEKRTNTQYQHYYRNTISNFAVLDKLEAGMLKYLLREPGEVFEVAVLVSITYP